MAVFRVGEFATRPIVEVILVMQRVTEWPREEWSQSDTDGYS